MHRASAVALALLLGLTACARGQSADPQATPSATATTTEPTATATASEPEATQETTAWFVRFDADRDFWVEPETTLVPPTEGVAGAAMEFLFSADPVHPALFNLAQGGELLGVDIDDDILVVDVDQDFADAGHSSTEERAFAQQLAYTATQFDGVRAVRLLVDGQEIDELWGHLDWSVPVEPEQFVETPITIESPHWGEEVEAGTLTASGQANTFEATLAVRLIDPDGSVVEEEWITATSGSGTRGTWEHTFDAELEAPGLWVVEAEEPDPSGGTEGYPPLVVRTEFEVA